MKKYIFDIIYAASIILALILLFTNASFPQSNVITKPSQVIKLTWQPSIEPDVYQYAIFWCQGADTSLFPFNTGTDPDSLWMNEPISNWSFARVYDRKFHYEPAIMPGITYVRLGVAGINLAGKLGLIQCISKVIRVKTPAAITGVKVQ
jgi:hypothetical protein